MDRYSGPWPPPPDPNRPRRSWWKRLGMFVAVLLSVAGLVAVGLVVLLVVGINNWANNK